MSKEIISLEKVVQKSHCEYPEDLPEVVLSSVTRKANPRPVSQRTYTLCIMADIYIIL